MPNLLLVGETNNGKTMLASRFVRQHSGSADGKRTVLIVQAPPVPDENRFYAGILEALNAPYRPQETAARRHVQVLRLLRGVGLEILVIDDCDFATLDWAAEPDLLAFLAERTDQPAGVLAAMELKLRGEPSEFLHQNWTGAALQFCPACLSKAVPYSSQLAAGVLSRLRRASPCSA